jgi:heat shock protein HslJ
MKWFSIIIVVLILLIGSWWFLQDKEDSGSLIGGERDTQGCLTAAGYSFNETIGACARQFELTPGIEEAASKAVEAVGRGYALTVVSFNSYEEPGAYDIVLERGEERERETVYIRDGAVVPAPAQLVSLEGTTWDFGERGRMSFEDGRYSASVGCNSIGGEYTVEGSSISFGQGMMTLMACEPDVEEDERALLETLPAINSFSGSGSVVTLIGEGAELVLRQPTNSELIGTQWNINSIKEGDGIVSASIDEGTFLNFEADGTFSGKSACNSFMGAYEISGETISFSNIGATKMACPEEQMARERILLMTLENATIYSIDRDVVSIESADREYRLTLTAGAQE